MAKHAIRIDDNSNNQFGLVVTMPLWGSKSWQTVEKGWLRYTNGPAILVDKTPSPFFQRPGDVDMTRRAHMYLTNVRESGIILFDFFGWTGPNTSGRGFLIRDWEINADAGPFGWTLL